MLGSLTFVLHAALIGLPSTGKSTLFQLMTSAKDAPRGHGKTETAVGISKVPDARLDRLTAMYNPRKRVPATIEFTDIVAPGRTGARRRSSTSPATRTPTRSCTSCARFATRRCRIPPASIDPARDAQAMEDELILADLGVVERRLERLEKDLKKNKSTELERERDLLLRCKDGARERPAAARARPRRRRSAAAARLSAALGQAAAARDQPRRGGRRRRRPASRRRRRRPG